MPLPLELALSGRACLRLLEERDLPGLEWHGGPDLRSFYHALWRGHQSGEITVLVVDFAAMPMAQIAIHWAGKPSCGHFPDQQSLRVHPAVRGQGLGTRLIKASEDLVRERGFKKIGLSVALDNAKARQLYERLNYQVTGQAYEDHWSYLDAEGKNQQMCETVIDMVKQLS